MDIIDQNPKRFELESDIVDAHETLEEVVDI